MFSLSCDETVTGSGEVSQRVVELNFVFIWLGIFASLLRNQSVLLKPPVTNPLPIRYQYPYCLYPYCLSDNPLPIRIAQITRYQSVLLKPPVTNPCFLKVGCSGGCKHE
eukprot:gene25233-biopygen2234